MNKLYLLKLLNKEENVLLYIYHLSDTVLGTGNRGRLGQTKYLPLCDLQLARVCKDFEQAGLLLKFQKERNHVKYTIFLQSPCFHGTYFLL